MSYPSGPQYPYGPPPPPQPPKPGMSTGAKVGLGVGLGCGIPILLLVMLVGCAALLSSPASESTASPTPAAVEDAEEVEEATEEETHPGLGDVVEHGDWEITVISIEYDVPTSDLESIFAEDPSGQWVVVELEATNVSSGPAYFTASDQVLMDDAGSMYTNDIMSSEGIDALGQVNPGGSVSGQLAIDVPEGTEISHMLVNGKTFFDEGVRVDLD